MYFDVLAFVISLIVTIIHIPWMVKCEDSRKRFFYLFLLAFYFLICGLTASLVETEHYLSYYVYYTSCFFFTLFFTRNLSLNLKVFRSDDFFSFWKKYAKVFIFIYFIYKMIPFFYPVFKLGNLFMMPSLDGRAMLDEELEQTGLSAGFGQLMYAFYLTALAAYYNKPKKVIGILLFFFYLDFAQSGYTSRGGILRLLVLIFIIVYLNYPKLRKKMMVIAGTSVPLLVIFFVWYMYKRLGVDEHLGFWDSLGKMAEVEFSFSMAFDTVYEGTYADPWAFIQSWITMPLPGPLRFGSEHYLVNYQYTQDIYGMDPSDPSAAVLLPGLAIEGAYCMGVGLAFIHAFLIAITINLFYNLFLKTKVFYMFSLYWIIQIPMGVIRGGSLTLYSFTNKVFIVMALLIYFLYVLSKKPSHS